MNGRRIRACIVLPSHWAAGNGGAEFQVRCLLDELEKHQEFEVFYLAHNVPHGFKPRGYRLLPVGHRLPIWHNLFLLDAPRLLATLRDIAPDVIYQRVGGSYTGIAAYHARRSECRMVWHVASTMDVSPARAVVSTSMIGDYLEKRALEYGVRNADCIIAQTEEQAELLAANYGREVDAVIPNFHPVPRGEIDKGEGVTVVWIANLKPLKRPELFLDLAEELGPLAGVRFVIVGRGNDGRWCRRLLRRMEGMVHLEYLGERSHEEVNRILDRADILVNTSEVEGFPNTFIQAWMREVPVVSMDIDPDNVMSRYNIGFRSGSYRQMVEDARRLIVDDGLRRRMGRDAREYAQANHSQGNAARIIDILAGMPDSCSQLRTVSNQR